MIPTLGVGIIGYGFIGKVHAYAYRTIPFHYDPVPVNTRLVAVATSRRETAEAARVHGGFESCTDDWRALIAMPEVRIVHICSPTGAHVDQLEAALAAGKHVYCEKPIVATAAEASRVRRALEGWQGIGQMTFHNRFYSAAQKARQLVDKGFLGTPLGFRGVYLHAGNIDPSVPMRWRLRKAAGGGVLRDLGAHLLDLVEFLGGPIVAISATSRILHAIRPDGHGGTAPVDVEDQICMTARLESGAVGTLEASKIATGAEDDLRLEIEGTRGALRFNVMEPDFLEAYSLDDTDAPMGGDRGWKKMAVLQRYPAPAVFPSHRATSGWLRGHVHCLHNFLSAVAAGRPTEPSLARGLAVQGLIQAAEKAGATGAWQTVAPL